MNSFLRFLRILLALKAISSIVLGTEPLPAAERDERSCSDIVVQSSVSNVAVRIPCDHNVTPETISDALKRCVEMFKQVGKQNINMQDAFVAQTGAENCIVTRSDPFIEETLVATKCVSCSAQWCEDICVSAEASPHHICFGHGHITEDASCQCDPGFFGENCEVADIASILYPKTGNPIESFENFLNLDLDVDLPAWGSDHYVFRGLISRRRPVLILEVGSWKGASAIHMANVLASEGISANILCVDTWLGSAALWEMGFVPDLWNGFSTIFYKFMNNIRTLGLSDRIVPLPLHSASAAILLQSKRIKADFIYIDGSHDEGSVLEDLELYWDLLNDDGIMMGDDYAPFYDGVIRAANRFCARRGLQLHYKDLKYWIHKPRLRQ